MQGCLGRAIEQHLDAIPSKLRPTFRKFSLILVDGIDRYSS